MSQEGLWPETASPQARADMDTVLGLALDGARRLLRVCEPFPLITVTIATDAERVVTVSNFGLDNPTATLDLIWADVRRRASEITCVAVAVAALSIDDQGAAPYVAVWVEHAEDHAVAVSMPYQRRRRPIRAKVTVGPLYAQSEEERRVWTSAH